MAKFKISPTTTVAELKEQFRNEVGGVLRIYEGRSEAAEGATLVSLGAKEGELECRTSRTVGKFEEAFQNDLNLKVKVYTKDNWVKVLDGITLETASKLPNGMTKAKMEEYLSYKRDEKEETAEAVNEDSNIEYGKTSEGMRSFCKDDKWGFEDEDGNIVIPPKYAHIGYFQNGLCPVANDDFLYGLINKRGDFVVDMVYERIDELTDNRRRFQTENYKYGFLNENGKVVIEPIYIDAHEFRDGLCGVQVESMGMRANLWGFIDVNGNMVIEPQFTRVSYKGFKDGLCEVELGEDDLTIDKTGKVLKEEKNPLDQANLSNTNTNHKEMKKINIYLYGEGRRLDVFDTEDDFSECYNAMRDGEYFDITVEDGETETSYSYDDFGGVISSYAWPEEVYNEDEEKFIDPNYTKFEGKEPSEVFEFDDRCNLYEAGEEGVGRIDLIQTKIHATVTIELNDDEEFDPKKLHFMYSEFVVPDAELEVNTGVVYDGKQYDIKLDIESEREISSETIWEA